jgi:hypothetical protein
LSTGRCFRADAPVDVGMLGCTVAQWVAVMRRTTIRGTTPRMSEFKIFPRDKLSPFTLPTGQPHRVVVHRYKVAMVEVEDLHFHLDSAVMMPDRDPADAVDAKSGADLTALVILRACYLYAKEHPGKKVVCLGHTDRSGDDPYNLELSKQRAHNVWAVMMGKQDEWTKLCMAQHVVRDYQLILKWIANVRYWPDCDPGKVDGTHGSQTSNAIRAFKKRYNENYGGSLNKSGVVDQPTWDAFFKMYMVGLAGVMQVEENGLDPYRQALAWLDPAWDGCGECHPITADTAANYRSPVDRRVEVLFFESGEEPRFCDCHPSAKSRVPEECELYRKDFLGKRIYVVEPIPVESNAEVSLQLTEVRGLYNPKYSDPADVAAETALASGYDKGYKSQDDLGRIFINQIPRTDTSVSWEDVKKKNQQFIELSATIEVAKGTLPADAQVVWQWSDPDDPSDTTMRDDAAAVIDPNDFDSTGKRVANQDGDNHGECDFPTPGASKEPAFEQIGPYTLTAGPPGSRSCFTLVSGGKSEVRFHCTDAGGDNFVLTATVRAAPNLKVTKGDATGIMTMWKRVDVEYRRMASAESIPAEKIPAFFEKQFVQMDIRKEQKTKQDKPYIDEYAGDDGSTRFINNEFEHKKKPGWFFICVARELGAPSGRPRHSLYEGPAKLVVESSPSSAPPPGSTDFEDDNLPYWESIVIDDVLTETPLAVMFREGDQKVVFLTYPAQPNVPTGKTTIRLLGIDFQSDFEPCDGSLSAAYAKRAFYFPRFRYRWPERIWEKRGYGFSENVYVNVVSRGSSLTSGRSPSLEKNGIEYFAGRTFVFCRHPGYTKPATAELEVQGTWTPGDELSVTVNGVTAVYQVTTKDVTVPAGAPDSGLYIRGQVARGIEGAINTDPALSAHIAASAEFGKLTLKALSTGSVVDGVPLSASPDTAAGRPGVLAVSAPGVFSGSGFGDEARVEIIQTLAHELGHAFGFPHKCGYHTFENLPRTSCTMNYFHTWLYKLGTHLAPAGRVVERFEPGERNGHFCAHHTRGLRLGKLEENPVMWSW